MDTTNWLDILPKDILDTIVKWCDDGGIKIMTYVSIGMKAKFSRYCSDTPFFDPYNYGAIHDNINIIKFFTGYGFKCTITAANCAATHGRFEIIRYLHYISCPFDSNICTQAVHGGGVDVLVWLRDNGFAIQESTIATAARIGNLHMVEWLWTNGYVSDLNSHFATDNNIGYNAALGGHLNILQWIHAKGYPLNDYICKGAIASNNLEVLQWLHQNGYRSTIAISYAAGEGHIDILQWLHSEGYYYDQDACISAARQGHLHVLKWLHYTGYPWDHRACENAAYSGHLEVFQWLRENGCPGYPYSAYTCNACAAAGGHLNVLKYLIANGYPCDKKAMCNSAFNGHIHILEWIHTNGVNGHDFDESIWKSAIRGHRLKVLEWAHSKGYIFNDTICEYATDMGNQKILQWLKENNYPNI